MTTANAQTDAEIKALQAYMTPGEMHKMMAMVEGEWTTDGKMWMDPKGQPVASKGEASYKMILGGRYQESTFRGDMMGMPFEGKGLMAYDNLKKQFENTWVDNMSSGIMKTEGTYDPGTKTYNMSGKMVDPMSGKECKMRETLKIVDNDTHVMSMYVTMGDNPEYKTMELTFKRKK
jgi:hypothetical protein